MSSQPDFVAALAVLIERRGSAPKRKPVAGPDEAAGLRARWLTMEQATGVSQPPSSGAMIGVITQSLDSLIAVFQDIVHAQAHGVDLDFDDPIGHPTAAAAAACATRGLAPVASFRS